MHQALIWLIVIEVVGVITLPMTYRLLGSLPDRGIIFSKAIGLLLAAYLFWALGLAGVLPNVQWAAVVVVAALAVPSAMILWRNGPDVLAFLRRERTAIIAAELVFLAFFLIWVALASFAPAINHTEQPMDFGFLNSILKSESFPPEDHWLSGHSISYYYFGHFMMAFLTKLTAIPSSVSYNLSIALIAALAAGGVFCLALNLVRIMGAGIKSAIPFALAAPVFILVLGNLEGVAELINAAGLGGAGFWDWLGIKGLDENTNASRGFFPDSYFWWWRSSRIIDTVVEGVSLDYTITEVPFFSFLLGDLHAHVNSLPFIALNLALILNLFLSREDVDFRRLLTRPWEGIAIGLLLGGLAFINIWDFPVMAALLAIAAVAKAVGNRGISVQALAPMLGWLVPVLAVAVIAYLPFYADLSSQASGILPVKDAMSTRPIHFLMIWGLPLAIVGGFMIKQGLRTPGMMARNPGLLGTAIAISILPFVLWVAAKLAVSPFDGGVGAALGDIVVRFARLIPAMVIVGAALYTLVLRERTGANPAVSYLLVLAALAFYLLMGSELFYLSDLFGTRMNTIFKLYYQVWILLGVVSAVGLYYVWRRPAAAEDESDDSTVEQTAVGAKPIVPAHMGGILKVGWLCIVAALILGALYFPVASARDVYIHGGGKSLDGLDYLKRSSPDEYESVLWLRDEAPPGRIVEAVGGSYTEFGRVAAATGLATLVNWPGHQRQWRGHLDVFSERERFVEEIYTSVDQVRVRQLLDAYDIRYVYAGSRERSKYGPLQLDEFGSFLKPVMQRGDVVIYERTPFESEVIHRENGRAG